MLSSSPTVGGHRASPSSSRWLHHRPALRSPTAAQRKSLWIRQSLPDKHCPVISSLTLLTRVWPEASIRRPGYAELVRRKIIGYHQDELVDWVAELPQPQPACSSSPPVSAPRMVLDAGRGRGAWLGTPPDCPLSDRPELDVRMGQALEQGARRHPELTYSAQNAGLFSMEVLTSTSAGSASPKGVGVRLRSLYKCFEVLVERRSPSRALAFRACGPTLLPMPPPREDP